MQSVVTSRRNRWNGQVECTRKMRKEYNILFRMNGRRHIRNLGGFLEDNHKIFVWKQGGKLEGGSALN